MKTKTTIQELKEIYAKVQQENPNTMPLDPSTRSWWKGWREFFSLTGKE